MKVGSPSETWSLFLAPAQGLDKLVPGYVAAQRYWVLDPSEHPVVEWKVLPKKDECYEQAASTTFRETFVMASSTREVRSSCGSRRTSDG